MSRVDIVLRDEGGTIGTIQVAGHTFKMMGRPGYMDESTVFIATSFWYVWEELVTPKATIGTIGTMGTAMSTEYKQRQTLLSEDPHVARAEYKNKARAGDSWAKNFAVKYSRFSKTAITRVDYVTLEFPFT